MRLDQSFYDGETQSKPLRMRLAIDDPVKRIEQERQRRGRNAGPAVSHDQPN